MITMPFTLVKKKTPFSHSVVRSEPAFQSPI